MRRQGRGCAASLGHDVLAIDIGADLVARLKEARPEVAFVALHGPGGEDGTVQELLEILRIPYTGPGVRACVRSSTRWPPSTSCAQPASPTPDWAAFNAVAFRELGAADTLEEIEANLGFPLVVKPAAGGSSLGVRFAAAAEEVPAALLAAFSYDDRVLLERHLEGRELAISLINGIALPAVEVVPREEDRFNYEARYEIGRSEYVCPADLGAAEGPILDAALRTWDVLGFDGFCRVDMILCENGPQVLEANAIPASPTPRYCRWPVRPRDSGSSASASACWSWRWSASRSAPPLLDLERRLRGARVGAARAHGADGEHVPSPLQLAVALR